MDGHGSVSLQLYIQKLGDQHIWPRGFSLWKLEHAKHYIQFENITKCLCFPNKEAELQYK